MQQLRERQYDESELDAIGRLQARSVVITPYRVSFRSDHPHNLELYATTSSHTYLPLLRR